MPGQVIILNGAPRAGKSSLARALQETLPGLWLAWGVDAFNATLPPALLPGIGLRPGGEMPEFEPMVARLYANYAAMLAGLARNGFGVIADLGLHRNFATPIDPSAIVAKALAGLEVHRIGIDCDISTIMDRRNANPAGYAAGPGIPEPVQRWQDSVHDGHRYDLRLDMGRLTTEQGAASIAAYLAGRVQ